MSSRSRDGVHMADLLVTNRIDPDAWDPAEAVLRSAGPVDLTRATDLFGLMPLGGDCDRSAVAAVRRRDDTAELLALVVRADRRGRGLGGRLLDGVADALRVDGADQLWATDGAGGRRWLIERGFEPASHGGLVLML